MDRTAIFVFLLVILVACQNQTISALLPDGALPMEEQAKQQLYHAPMDLQTLCKFYEERGADPIEKTKTSAVYEHDGIQYEILVNDLNDEGGYILILTQP